MQAASTAHKRGREEQPHIQGVAAARVQEGLRRYSMFKIRRGGGEEIPTPHPRYGAAAALRWSSREEIPHIQGKRNPSKTVGVARGHQRASEGRHTETIITENYSQSNHMDHSLV